MNLNQQTRRETIFHISSLLTFASLPGLGCAPQQDAASNIHSMPPYSLAAAASLQVVLQALLKKFISTQAIQEPRQVYGASGSLLAQILAGAPHDLFFSADTSYPRKVIEAGLADEADHFTYAKGRLALWVPNYSPLFSNSRTIDQGFDLLRQGSNRRIAIANPRLAPYGQAAIEAISNVGLHDHLENMLVYGENVAQTAHLAHSGAADAAFIALSQALAPPLADTGQYWLVPDEYHEPLIQSGVILKNAAAKETAYRIRDFVIGTSSQDVWQQYGYERVEG